VNWSKGSKLWDNISLSASSTVSRAGQPPRQGLIVQEMMETAQKPEDGGKNPVGWLIVLNNRSTNINTSHLIIGMISVCFIHATSSASQAADRTALATDPKCSVPIPSLCLSPIHLLVG
jgi:hypothetical protein